MMEAVMDTTGVDVADDRGPWIQTFLGGRFYPVDPDPLEVDPRDIAVALSNIGRYVGHTVAFYSVAQHSWLASETAMIEYKDEDLARLMLLHDATEAYLGDVSRPLKSLLPEYRDIEARAWVAIAERFNLPREHDERVKAIDNQLLALEKATLQPNAEEWPGVESLGERLTVLWTPQFSQVTWWGRFKELFPWDPVVKPMH